MQHYNVQIRQFPGVVIARIFGYQPRPNFGVANAAAISVAPTLDFSAQPQPPKANVAGE